MSLKCDVCGRPELESGLRSVGTNLICGSCGDDLTRALDEIIKTTMEEAVNSIMKEAA
jgi:hypothetical protein